MKRVLVLLLLMVVALFAIPTSAFAVEVEPKIEKVAITEQHKETKPVFNFKKGFKNIRFNGANKPKLSEGLEKPDMCKFKENGFANFQNFDKEAIREKLDEMLAEGKITKEKHDAIISGEFKPSFDGKKPRISQHKKLDTDSKTYKCPRMPMFRRMCGDYRAVL